MAYTWYHSPGANASVLSALSGWSSQSGTAPALDTAVKEHGYASWRWTSPASAPAAMYGQRNDVLSAAGGRVLVTMRFGVAFGISGGSRIIAPMDTANSTRFAVSIDNAGFLRLNGGSSGTLNKVAASALSLDTWYTIELVWGNLAATNNYSMKVFVNGVEVISATGADGTISGILPNRLAVGWRDASSPSAVVYINDVIVDDVATLASHHTRRVTAKRPAGLGTNNAWDTLTGTTAGGRWGYVNERAANTANRIGQLATSGQLIEAFTVQALNTGDDDLTGKTILDWAGWSLFAVAEAAATSNSAIVVNGVATPAVRVGASGVYETFWKSANSTTIPTSGNVVGHRSTGSAVDTLLAECGVVVVYDNPAGPAATPIAANDSQALNEVEAATLRATQTRTDSQALGRTESATLRSTQTRTDSQNVTQAEAPALRATQTRTDAQSLTQAEAPTLRATQTRADAQAITQAEAPTLRSTQTRADAQAVAQSEAPSLRVAVNLSDTQALASTDTATQGQATVAKAATDAQALGRTEAATLRATQTRVDAQAVDEAEAATLRSTQTRPDTGSLDEAEAATLRSTQVRPDAGSLDEAEAATLRATQTRTDAQALQRAESLALRVTLGVSDTQALGSADTASYTESEHQVPSSDAQSITQAEAATLRVTQTRTDSQALDETEVATLRASQIRPDAGSAASSDTATLRARPTLADSPALGVTEAIGVRVRMSLVDAQALDEAESGSRRQQGSIDATPSASDSQALGSVDSVQLRAAIPAVDTRALAAADGLGIRAHLAVNDSGLVTAADTLSLFARLPILDAQAFGRVESAGLFARLSTQVDSGALGSTDLASGGEVFLTPALILRAPNPYAAIRAKGDGTLRAPNLYATVKAR